MAKIEDSALGNYNNDGSQSDNESNDDLFPITTKNAGKNKRHRKRSSSLPFIEATHTGLWKGVVAATDMQFVTSNQEGKHSRKEQKEKTWKGFPANESAGMEQNSLGEHHPTRRSSSMPEFYSPSSEIKKDGQFKHRKTKRSGSKPRKRVMGTATTDLEMQGDEETFKLPVISSESIPSTKSGEPEDQSSNELEALSQSMENTKIHRKTYLPRINNSNNGGVFMKSR